MLHIDSTSFGSVTINGRRHRDVTIIGEKIEQRDYNKLFGLFGTDHLVSDWEVQKLLSTKPEIVIIGSGQSGVLKVTGEVKDKLTATGVELKILITPEAIKEYNKLINEGRKVNALIHTTC